MPAIAADPTIRRPVMPPMGIGAVDPPVGVTLEGRAP
jgi:hypothetical protein